jgi:tetratricopeptide (TPR) repeat protein
MDPTERQDLAAPRERLRMLHEDAPEPHERVTVRELHIRFQYPPFWRYVFRHGLLSLAVLVLFVVGVVVLTRRAADRVQADRAMATTPSPPEVEAARAMALAERSLMADAPDPCAFHVRQASAWGANAEAVRALYPYLCRTRRWSAVADAEQNIRVPHSSSIEALCAAAAFLHNRKPAQAASIMLQAIEAWPRDPAWLGPLLYMRALRGPGDWETRLETHLLRCLPTIDDAVALFALIEQAFQIQRPDLAWSIFSRLTALDEDHPARQLALARFASTWFRFRRHGLGMPSDDPLATVDINALFLAGCHLHTWQPICKRIPSGSVQARGGDPAAAERARALFRQQYASGDLNIDEQYLFADALADVDRRAEALIILQSIASQDPREASQAARYTARMMVEVGDWASVYESLYEQPDRGDATLDDFLLLCNAQRVLGLGLSAWHTAQRARSLFPASPRAKALLARCLLDYDAPSSALFSLQTSRAPLGNETDALTLQCLAETRRFAEMERFRQSAMLPAPYLADRYQPFNLPSAELSLLWHITSVPPKQTTAKQRARHTDDLPTHRSPFLADLQPLWIGAACEDPPPDGLDAARWKACGRNAVEQAEALFQLVLLQCQHNAIPAASKTAAMATDILPDCPLLWRVRIGLSGATSDVLVAARRACPEDAEIWLATLVSQAGTGDHETISEAVTPLIAEAVQGRFPPEALTRAAEFLRQSNLPKPAAKLARQAQAMASGLVPAHMAALRCALDLDDLVWARQSIESTIEACTTPQPVLQNALVALREASGPLRPDPSVVAALQFLQRTEPYNPRWPRLLGGVRFQRGGFDTLYALDHLTDAIELGINDVDTYLLAAEAARQVGNFDRSADILREAAQTYPNDLAVLNNLVYTLTLRPETVKEAARLMPRLLVMGRHNQHILDTVSMVYLREGNLAMAKAFASDLWRRSESGSTLWVRAGLNLTEIALREGHLTLARSGLDHILENASGIPDEELVRASALQTGIENTEPR